jgi:two-component system cell cycle sensor histidine kinase/response regulator CckA
MSSPLRVLIVEDSLLDAELLVRALERGDYAVTHQRVETAHAMQAALNASPWDVVLSDYELPSFSGPAALAVLQQSGLDLPFIMISGTIGEEIAVGALKAGAHDFLVKGRLARLVPAIERELREVDERRERLRAEQALRRSEAQYRSLVEGAVFGIYQVGPDGGIVTANSALVAMLGFGSANELIATGLSNVFADPQVMADVLRRSSEEARIAGEEVMWRRKEGEEIRVRLSGRRIDEQDPGGVLFEVIVEDITERHRLYEQLQQARKMEAIGQLAGGVAHDFNNMLTAILGYSELLTEQVGADKPIGRDLLEIKAAAERAAALTRQLLAFGRKQVLTLSTVNLTEVVRTVEPMLRRLLGERLTITTDLASDLVSVTADAAQLEHVLVNLAVNARDAMPGGGVVSFTTANVDLDEGYVATHPGATLGPCAMVRVGDTGVGMSAVVQKQIFEPFFTTKERGRGTGLGLAAVYGTVKQFGGYIEVDSEVGRGTTFTIYLQKSGPSVRRAPVVAAAAAPVGNETVLIVEDESGVRAFVKTALQRFGYRVIEADSGEAALSLLELYDGPVDLLLTDVGLPGIDGRELATTIARTRPDMRIVFMSGYAPSLSSRPGALDDGIDLLEKPFTALALLTKTRQSFERPVARLLPPRPTVPTR